MNKEFTIHVLNENGKNHTIYIAAAFDHLLDTLLTYNPEPSREMSLVRTKLEEAYFYAKKAMANQVEYVEG